VVPRPARRTVWPGTTWSRQATLTPATGAANSHYGIVSLSPAGNRAVVGAVGDVVTTFPVAVFAASGTTWTEQPVVAIPPDNAAHFGVSVSLDTNALVVGAQSGSAGSLNGTGAAYLYTIGQSNGNACTSATDCLSGFCVDGVCCNNACGGGSTTDCQACSTAKGGTQTGAARLYLPRSRRRHVAPQLAPATADKCTTTHPLPGGRQEGVRHRVAPQRVSAISRRRATEPAPHALPMR
jgi:hypothetical protein